VIILTGASGGVGYAILSSLSKLDSVIAVSHSTNINIDDLSGVDLHSVDLTSENEVNKFVSTVKEKLSNVVLIHAAAISLDNIAVKFDTKDWHRSMSLNLDSNFFLTRALLTTMIQDGWGRIIHVSSIAGIKGAPGTIAYSTAKTGLMGMSKVLANDTLNEDTRKKIIEEIPSKKLGDPSNIVNAIDFLIKSEYVNGSKIHIDGGI